MIGPGYTKTAGGNITPMRFVILSTTVDRVTQATGTATGIFGISQRGTRRPPLSPLDDGFAAIAGESLGIFGPDDMGARLELGGTVTAGDYLTSDGSGKGVTTTTTGQFIGARAMQSGVSGDCIEVQPMVSYQY